MTRKPDWQSEDGTVRLYRGDCLDVLPELEAGSVDAVVTDPPYGVRDDEWDDLDAFQFARLSMAWMAEARRIAPELVTFCFADNAVHSLAKMLYPRVRQMVWYKPPGSQYAGASERKLWFAHETILHCHQQKTWSVVEPKERAVADIIRAARKRAGLSCGGVDMAVRGKKTGLCYRWEEAACLPTPEQVERIKPLLGLNGELDDALSTAYAARDETKRKAAEKAAEKADVFAYRTLTGGVHPCEKPIPLLEDIVATVGDEWRAALDPFMGSGTTGIACVNTGRQFIGIEKEPRYFDIAVSRIEKAIADRDSKLFTEAAA